VIAPSLSLADARSVMSAGTLSTAPSTIPLKLTVGGAFNLKDNSSDGRLSSEAELKAVITKK